MTRVSNQYGAINLSQGFPDFDPPQAILDRLAETAREDACKIEHDLSVESFDAIRRHSREYR